MTRHHPTSTQHFRGAALMAVLWLIAILSLACMASLRVISFDLQIAGAKIHGSRARQMAEMGIAIACNPAIERTDPLLQRLDPKTDENFEVKLMSEGGRFNINQLVFSEDKSQLRELFIRWGLELDAAQALTDAFADWVDPDDNVALKGAEKGEYEKLGRFNQPFNRPFYSVAEMALVRGMDAVEARQPDWRNWFTIWSDGTLDLNEASAELIAAAAEVSIERAEAIPKAIRGPDGIRDTADDLPFESLAEPLQLLGIDPSDPVGFARRFSLKDSTVRIESTGSAEGAKRKITVIIRNRAAKPALLDRIEEIIP
jgi:general secretion pathway protein K